MVANNCLDCNSFVQQTSRGSRECCMNDRLRAIREKLVSDSNLAAAGGIAS
jgi:hypothetical protein